MPTIDVEQDTVSHRREAAGRRATSWSLALIVAGLAPARLQAALAPLDGVDTVDRFGLLLSLATVPALALVALWSNRNAQS